MNRREEMDIQVEHIAGRPVSQVIGCYPKDCQALPGSCNRPADKGAVET